MTTLKKKSTRLALAGTSAAAAAVLLAAGMAPAAQAVVAGSAGTVTSNKASGNWSVEDLAATEIGSDMTCASTGSMDGALLFISEPGQETPAVANATTEARSVYPFTLDPMNQMSFAADGSLADTMTLDGGFVKSDKTPVADMAAALLANHTYSIGYTCTTQSDDFGTATVVPASGKAVASWATLTTDASKNWTITAPKFAPVAAPTVAGTAVVGSTLKATAKSSSPSADSTKYQWLRNGATISGATKSSYVLTAADLGKKISVKVTYVKTGYADVSATSVASATVAAAKFSSAPIPTISGTAAVGYTLKASVGTASPSATVKYQWLRDGKSITGATNSSYKLTSSDRARKITVRVEFSRSGYTTVTKTAASRTGYGVFSYKKPSVTGTMKVGRTVKASSSSSPTASSKSYQWLRNGKAISKATKSSYKLTSRDKGRKISVKVTFKRSGYLTGSSISSSRTVR
ncbi:hypothetical protein LVY72_00335 [Arthrobacter sp. I2-34]|uniref:Ig-like domain-containing protein n=1 Tax=Arthrobacter hankyongi TaxID=2904801 RepID=A0ABS9L138_9MICC|nr:hypothetical protein [Arthrobacter hankyongi]MCG2620356.1 hypothetical protein [Arthrobacter hankyongi]